MHCNEAQMIPRIEQAVKSKNQTSQSEHTQKKRSVSVEGSMSPETDLIKTGLSVNSNWQYFNIRRAPSFTSKQRIPFD